MKIFLSKADNNFSQYSPGELVAELRVQRARPRRAPPPMRQRQQVGQEIFNFQRGDLFRAREEQQGRATPLPFPPALEASARHSGHAAERTILSAQFSPCRGDGRHDQVPLCQLFFSCL